VDVVRDVRLRDRIRQFGGHRARLDICQRRDY
jgi:hypothetical protein